MSVFFPDCQKIAETAIDRAFERVVERFYLPSGDIPPEDAAELSDLQGKLAGLLSRYADNNCRAPEIGSRARITVAVDRFPNCVVSEGATGTVVHADAHCIKLFLDERVIGLHATEWDNCILFANECEHWGNAAGEFWAHCELIEA